MLCQNCGKNEVNFRYTQIIKGVKKEMALCDKCARELGIEKMDFNMPINFASFLGDFLEDYDSEAFLPSFTKSNTLKCDKCGMTYDEFVSKGKFGCDNCYEVFEDRINPVLKNIHGSSEHIGRNSKLIDKITTKKEKIKEKIEDLKEQKEEVKQEKDELKALKEDLKNAIKEERYEDAARLRDEIKKIEG